jgi:hypothetical protein
MPQRMCVAILLVCVIAPPPAAAQMTDSERQRLVAHLEMTRSWLVDEVSGLAPGQLRFRPTPDSWSILEVLDHLVVVGAIYWEDLQRAVRAGPSDRVPWSRDEDILWYGINRANREAAIPAETPKGNLRDLRAGLEAHRAAHARLLEYVKTTPDDLRRRHVARQGSDAYQWALLISTHEQRHILQIREIKANPRFPPP